MGNLKQGIIAAAALGASLSFVPEASAIKPVPQGTFKLAAERLISSDFTFAGGTTTWNNQIFGAAGNAPITAPRLGADYFIIDGLSLGGHASVGFNTRTNNSLQGRTAILPRVGYAFALGNVIDFWPRGGFGILVDGNESSGLISLEAMFLANLDKRFALEFGPAVDIPLSRFYPDAVVGGNAGFVVTF